MRAFDDSDQGGPGSALCSLFFCYILSPLVVHSVFFFASVADPFSRSPPPHPPLRVDEKGAIARTARAITLASNLLYAQSWARLRDLING